jgi:hypothetical protein
LLLLLVGIFPEGLLEIIGRQVRLLFLGPQFRGRIGPEVAATTVTIVILINMELVLLGFLLARLDGHLHHAGASTLEATAFLVWCETHLGIEEALVLNGKMRPHVDLSEGKQVAAALVLAEEGAANLHAREETALLDHRHLNALVALAAHISTGGVARGVVPLLVDLAEVALLVALAGLDHLALVEAPVVAPVVVYALALLELVRPSYI